MDDSPSPYDGPDSTPPLVQRTSGMAIASLVLGLLSFIFSFLTGLPALILGIVSLVKINNSRGALTGMGMAITGIVTGGLSMLILPLILIALLLPAVQAAREAARANMSMNNMKQIGLAMHLYSNDTGNFPAAGLDASGVGPQLSWRVHILPYIEQKSLYEQFHLDEPWDSEHNRQFLDRMPEIFLSPGGRGEVPPGKTVYLAVTGDKAAFQGGQTGPRLRDFVDGMSNTILVVEADPDQAAPWTKPDDYRFDPNNPLRGLGNFRIGTFLAAFADGSVRMVSADIAPQSVSALITRDGREPPPQF